MSSFKPLELPTPPKFPTFLELVGKPIEEQEKKKADLFSSLIGDPQILFQDLLEHPEKYDQKLSPLLQELLGGHLKLNDLSEQQQQLLNEATIDYNQAQPKKPESLSKPKPKKKLPKEIEHKEAKSSLTLNGVKPYWWL